MWSLLPQNIQLLIIIGVAFLVAMGGNAVVLSLLGYELGWWQTTTMSATVVGLVLVAVAQASWRWVWRKFPAIQPRFFPDLNGTWVGHVKSTWKDGDGERGSPTPAVITIRQNLFSVSVTLKTETSDSKSTRAWLARTLALRRFRIRYCYENDVLAEHRERLVPHEGTGFLELDYDADPNRLTGRYYTDRKTTGDIEVVRAVVVPSGARGWLGLFKTLPLDRHSDNRPIGA